MGTRASGGMMVANSSLVCRRITNTPIRDQKHDYNAYQQLLPEYDRPGTPDHCGRGMFGVRQPLLMRFFHYPAKPP